MADETLDDEETKSPDEQGSQHAATPPDESGEHGNELAGGGGAAGTGESGEGVGGGGGPSRVI